VQQAGAESIRDFGLMARWEATHAPVERVMSVTLWEFASKSRPLATDSLAMLHTLLDTNS
jgi:hypothetical protein